MTQNIIQSWQKELKKEFEKEYFLDLKAFVENEYSIKTCYPPFHEIFNALNLCSFDDTKIVILGQDPYHGEKQANGLSFSVNDGIKHPPSLRNIFKELNEDLDQETPESGNLERWAKQGILLLNSTLTVEEGKAGSHQKKGWEEFTDEIIRKLNTDKSHLVFLLWGNYAQKKAKLIDDNKHLVLKSSHPSPLSANIGGWFGNRHFSLANEYLLRYNKKPINW